MNKPLHMKTTALMAAFLAVLLTSLGIVWAAQPAAAANIPGASVSISTDSVVTSQWDQVDVTCEWSVPDHSRPGDTFELKLPQELRWFGTTSFDLDNPEGETVATAVADDSGLVVFTLTDFVATHPLNVGGTCNFTTQYSEVPGNEEGEQLEFTIGDRVVRVPVTVNPCVTDCTPVPETAGKAMWWADAGQTRLESIIYMPPMPSFTNNVMVKDTPSAGMEIDCDDVTPRVGRTVNANGNITDPMETDIYPATIECTPQELTATWTGLPKGERVELFVVAQVTDATLDAYTNTGTVTIDGIENTVGAETRRTSAGGTGDGTATPTPTPTTATPTPTTATPTPTPTTATPTPTPTATTATPTPTMTEHATAEPSTSAPTPSTPVTTPAVEAPSQTPEQPRKGQDDTELATTGANGPAFVFAAAALLALGSLLAFGAARRSSQRRTH
ncbi:Ig-like domain-containing protein [Paenarthrobacter ureafaciens]|uniref:Ig-like domain-containing protein n=1 Tax=Paenarthrobacter ureafaciens TaxID=37931 RepID=UPI0015C068BB|nr:Ig-like domain-containing protein [Paenarthrobacter ureafaciens]